MPDINAIYKEAVKLTPDQRRQLITRLFDIDRPKRYPGALRPYIGIIKDGPANSTDNEQIDKDLARAYADDHEIEN